MKKLAIIKLIVLSLGIAIVFCISCIVIQMTVPKNGYKDIKQFEVQIPQNGTIKTFKANNGKIYMHIVGTEKEQLIILEEKTGNKISTINLIKGEN